MKTVYKYIKFELHEPPDHKRWVCVNKKTGTGLGEAIYYEMWHQWVVEFEEGCVFNNTCLNDISHFLTQLNKQSKAHGSKK
jgi:hypothetical protein